MGKDKPKTRPTPPVAVDVEEEPLTEEQEQLISEIREAFKGVKLGSGSSLNQTEDMDAARELKDYPEDEKEDWAAIPDRTLEDFGVVFSFADRRGYKFYLPAYMIWTIKHHRSAEYLEKRATQALDVDAAIYALDLNRHQFDEKNPFVEYFSIQQIQAMMMFLGYASRQDDLNTGHAEANLAQMTEAVKQQEKTAEADLSKIMAAMKSE